MATETITEQEVPSPAAVVFSNAYLDEIIDNVRGRPIAWDGYVRAGIVTEEEASALKAVDKVSSFSRTTALKQGAEPYAKTFTSIFSKTDRADVLQYSLVLAADLIIESEDLARGLNEANVSEILVKQLDHEDETVPLLIAKVLLLLIIATVSPSVSVVEKLLKFSNKFANSEDFSLKDLAAQSYVAILSVKTTRALFWQNITVYGPPLLDILKSGKGGLQLQYYGLVVFWLLAFETEPAQGLNQKCDIIPIVLDIIKTAIKEKIIRVSVSLFYNLITIAPEQNINALLVVNGLPIIKSMAQRKWTDTELEADLITVSTTLQEAHDLMSTFDEYKNELLSGRLRWSPAHKSLDFWKRNAQEFREEDWKLLKELAKVITTSTDNTVIAVAANDIGAIITEVPEGLRVLNKSGTKTKIMELLTHEDPEVKYQALKATQVFVARAFV
ncbi:armadillo-type protein [Lipomyces japonicus]|uniref:armadillo-type protein n=1 Tax=Lipomyces japonicus TaxID=56871 RepID=UPI0034CE35CB